MILLLDDDLERLAGFRRCHRTLGCELIPIRAPAACLPSSSPGGAAVCPVIVHSTNTDAAWGMHNVLSAAGWQVELVHHLNETGWIEHRWLPVAQRLLLGKT